MKNMSIIMAGLAAGLAFASTPQTAAAQPAHCPPGHAMKGWCDTGDGSARFRDRNDAYEEGYRDALDDLRVGTRLPRDRYRILSRDSYYDRYGRRLDDRYYYAEADGERLLIEAATGAIVDMLLR